MAWPSDHAVMNQTIIITLKITHMMETRLSPGFCFQKSA
jgi:hypothetical protein